MDDNSLPYDAGRATNSCYHGGAFFEAIGEDFRDLDRRHRVINADVLDAWFAPAPSVVRALTEHLPWLLRTSPPTHSEGLVQAIARARGVPARCLLPGAGSSDLIYLALRAWLTPSSRVLLLDPTYGEYAHVCEKVIGCRVDRLVLRREDGYRVDLQRLESGLQEDFDLVVLVNPNNPTGQHIPRVELEAVLKRVPARTLCWVDEAYTDYAGPGQSLEQFAVSMRNVVVCKSLSKAYALSGARAAYLAASEKMMNEFRSLTPPWAVSLPAQLAAVFALQEQDYYTACWCKTHDLRDSLAQDIRAISPSGEVLSGVGNWVLWYPPAAEGLRPAELALRCRTRGLFLRECAGPDHTSGADALRVAVKDSDTQKQIIEIIGWAMGMQSKPSWQSGGR